MFKIKRSELVGSRLDLAALANAKNLKTAVEVGTDRGVFAAEFLERWVGEMLYCIDPWEPYREMPFNRDGDMAMAIAVLAPHARRVRIIRCSSKQALNFVGKSDIFPSQFGMVYIDSAHDYETVLSDLEGWWPLVAPGGMLAGDDFDRHHPGVTKAVDEFAQHYSLTVELTQDYNRGAGFYVEKPLPDPEPKPETEAVTANEN